MSDEAELRALVVKLSKAMRSAGIVLSDIGSSKSMYADEAWAVFSQIVDALNEVKNVVDADLAKEATQQ
jgi:ethanolamine utilization microcompartment shell protein EutL